MNLQESYDMFPDVEIPSWIIQNIHHLQETSLPLQNQPSHAPPQEGQILIFPTSNNSIDQSPNTYRIQPHQNLSNTSNQSDQSQGEKRHQQKNPMTPKKQTKNKQQRRNQISKNYRERKKSHSKLLQTQNRFLRFKVDQLTFRLQQLTTQLNKLKNTPDTLNVPNYHKLKSQCFQQLEKMFQNNVQDVASYKKIEKKLGEVVAFNGKQKIELLNYFMSELMENVITDKAFYFIDCLINKKGWHRQNQQVKLSQLDMQIFAILKVQDKKIKSSMKKIDWQSVQHQCKKFQSLWKTLYQVYLAILNEGFKIQRKMQQARNLLQSFLNISDTLKLQLYFQKNKYRSDIREMRNLWFRELEKDQSAKELRTTNPQ